MSELNHVTPCECDGAGWCPRHRLEKTRFEFEMCRRMLSWFELWGRGGLRRRAIRRESPCLHRGEVVGEVECSSCKGRVRIKVFACAVHGDCTIRRVPGDRSDCDSCDEYSAATNDQQS